jgi:UTP-glucose-1-phosphate uridylyltransferase
MRAGFGKLVFVIRKDIEQQFREIVGARFEKRIAVDYVFQELNKLPAGYPVPEGRTKPWGTTHAIMMAGNAIKEPFAAINADDFYGQNAYKVLAQHLTSGTPDYAMVGFTLKNTLSDHGSVARGVSQVDAQNYLTHIVEMTKIERDGSRAKNTGADGKITPLVGDEPVSMNFWGFTPALFPQLNVAFEQFMKKGGSEQKSECLIPATVGELVTGGLAKCKVLRSPDSWFGVTYREDRPMVVESIRKLIAKGDYPEKLWA